MSKLREKIDEQHRIIDELRSRVVDARNATVAAEIMDARDRHEAYLRGLIDGAEAEHIDALEEQANG